MSMNLDELEGCQEEYGGIKSRVEHQSELILVLKKRADEYLTKYMKNEESIKAIEKKCNLLKNDHKLEVEKSKMALQINISLLEENRELKIRLKGLNEENESLLNKNTFFAEEYLKYLKEKESFIKKLDKKDISIRMLEISMKRAEEKSSSETHNLSCESNVWLKENNNLKECLTRKCKEVKLQNEVVKVELSKKNVENKSLELTVSQLTTQISVRAKTISYSHILIKKLGIHFSIKITLISTLKELFIKAYYVEQFFSRL